MTPTDTNELLAKLNATPDLSDTEKAYLREQLTSKKRYGLIWEDKPEFVEQQLLDSLPVLTEVPGRRVMTQKRETEVAGSNGNGRPSATPNGQITFTFDSEKSASLVDYHQSTNEADFSESIPPFGNTELAATPRSVRTQIALDQTTVQHALIEGDNLHALTVLNYTHAGQVDVIYIDPPYNTGNKDFKYNDTFVDREDSYRHSKWLSFMAKRLTLAKTLLKDTGVIFISIDDNEQAQLKLLCDEVFGEANFVANVIWEKNDSPKMDSRYFSSRHDFVLIYAKQFSQSQIRQLSVDDEDIAHYNKLDRNRKRYYLKPLRAMGGQGETREARPTLYYEIEAPDGTLVLPKRKDGSDGAWRWSKEKLIAESERIEWTNSKGGWSPNYRIYAENNDTRPPETI